MPVSNLKLAYIAATGIQCCQEKSRSRSRGVYTYLYLQQDSSLGSFEGDASRESLEGVGIDASPDSRGRALRNGRIPRQRPLTSLEPGRAG